MYSVLFLFPSLFSFLSLQLLFLSLLSLTRLSPNHSLLPHPCHLHLSILLFSFSLLYSLFLLCNFLSLASILHTPFVNSFFSSLSFFFHFPFMYSIFFLSLSFILFSLRLFFLSLSSLSFPSFFLSLCLILSTYLYYHLSISFPSTFFPFHLFAFSLTAIFTPSLFFPSFQRSSSSYLLSFSFHIPTKSYSSYSSTILFLLITTSPSYSSFITAPLLISRTFSLFLLASSPTSPPAPASSLPSSSLCLGTKGIQFVIILSSNNSLPQYARDRWSLD